MYFIFNALDKKNSVELRTQNRQTHLEFLKTSEENNIKILLAGPRINENKQMIGSTLVVECENKDVLEKWLEKDIHTNSARRIQICAPNHHPDGCLSKYRKPRHIGSNRKSVLIARRTGRPNMATLKKRIQTVTTKMSTRS